MSGDTGGRSWVAVLITTLVVVLILGAAALYVRSAYRSAQPFPIEASTTLSCNAAADRVTEGYDRAGWSATTLSDGRVLFSRTTMPNTGTALLLALFFVLPALLYILTSQRHQTAELRIDRESDRRIQIEILGNTTGYGGVNTAAGILRSLPK
jgi:type II secretory pathway pseudopilin PulG